jgi:acyl-CoA synthetase (AMP-forming)/AMP-acid ligase II
VLTGDLGYLDEDGYLFIVDRIKDLNIRGGENIACSEVESALYAHPGVAEASVFGLAPCALRRGAGGGLCGARGRHAVRAGPARLPRPAACPFKIPERMWQEHQPLPRLGTEKVDQTLAQGAL